MTPITPNEISASRSAITDDIMTFLEDWQTLKESQTKGRHGHNFKAGGLFNILDLLPTEIVEQAITLYQQIHHPNDGRKLD